MARLNKEEISQEQKELYEELKKLAKRANQRIVRLEREFGKDKWSVKNLRDRLDTQKLNAWTKTGRIKYNKSMSITELRAVTKATKQFLNSQTSTKRGIKQVRKKQIESLRISLSTDEKEFTFEEAETFYRLFEDTDYTFFIRKYDIPASAFNDLIQEAKEYNNTFDNFLENLEIYITIGNDKELLTRAQAIYEKYVKE